MTGHPCYETDLPPPLKWAGGKRWLIPRIRDLWKEHEHRRLVEPFCGGMAVTLGLKPHRALLNDVNPHLINFYRWIQRGLDLRDPLIS
jgi:DNA adenine methylase